MIDLLQRVAGEMRFLADHVSFAERYPYHAAELDRLADELDAMRKAG